MSTGSGAERVRKALERAEQFPQISFLANRNCGMRVHDTKPAAPTLDALVVARPAPTTEQPQHLCLDAGYDYDLLRFAAEQRGYLAHIRPRGEERAHTGSRDPLKRRRRWVVERLHSWLNRSRRLLVRWEKLECTYAGFLHLACALLRFQQCDRYRAAYDGFRPRRA